MNLLFSHMNNLQPDLTTRSHKKELMDHPDVTEDELFKAFSELNIINKWLGGHSATIAGLNRLIPAHQDSCKIIDFGCGGGGNLKTISAWANKRNIRVTLTGVDISPAAIKYSASYLGDVPDVILLQSDYRELDLEDNSYDVALTSLFCHHLYGDDLKDLLLTMKKCAFQGVILNDLHRHQVAYYSIKWLTGLISNSRLVKYDAPLSVAKGFKSHDFGQILQSAGITGYSISWRWAFRYLVTFR